MILSFVLRPYSGRGSPAVASVVGDLWQPSHWLRHLAFTHKKCLKNRIWKILFTSNGTLPVTLFAIDPSSQQWPLQSHPPPPKRSDKEVIFGYLGSGKHKNTFLLVFLYLGQNVNTHPRKWFFSCMRTLKWLLQNMGGRLLHCSLKITFNAVKKINASKKSPGSRDSEEPFLHLASSLGPTSAYPPSG